MEVATITILVLFQQMWFNQIGILKIILIIKEDQAFQRLTQRIYNSSFNKQKWLIIVKVKEEKIEKVWIWLIIIHNKAFSKKK